MMGNHTPSFAAHRAGGDVDQLPVVLDQVGALVDPVPVALTCHAEGLQLMSATSTTRALVGRPSDERFATHSARNFHANAAPVRIGRSPLILSVQALSSSATTSYAAAMASAVFPLGGTTDLAGVALEMNTADLTDEVDDCSAARHCPPNELRHHLLYLE